MSKISRFFRVKPKEKENQFIKTSWWYYIFVAALFIATLGVALLWPEQISALWFEFWLLVLQFLHTPVIFQMWWFIPFVFLVAWVGWLFLPVVEIPTTNDRYFYLKTWEEGDLRYFKTWSGYLLTMHKNVPKRRGLRWTAQAPVSRTPQGTLIVYQTKNLEVNTSLMWKRVAESLIEELKKYRAEKERKETSLTLEELIEIEKARHGGGEKQ